MGFSTSGAPKVGWENILPRLAELEVLEPTTDVAHFETRQVKFRSQKFGRDSGVSVHEPTMTSFEFPNPTTAPKHICGFLIPMTLTLRGRLSHEPHLAVLGNFFPDGYALWASFLHLGYLSC